MTQTLTFTTPVNATTSYSVSSDFAGAIPNGHSKADSGPGSELGKTSDVDEVSPTSGAHDHHAPSVVGFFESTEIGQAIKTLKETW